MSNDLRQIPSEFAKILQNKHLIQVDQDPLGVLGLMVASTFINSSLEIDTSNSLQQAFVKPVMPIINSCPSFAIVYLNRNVLGNKLKVK